MKIVLTTFDRKPPYVHDTLKAFHENGGAPGAEFSVLSLESHADYLSEDEYIDWLTPEQDALKERFPPKLRTKFATLKALEMGADVVLQDDLDFAPGWWISFLALLPVQTANIMVSLYYPRPAQSVGLVQWYARDYYGMQAMFFGTDARKAALEYLRDPKVEADDEALKRMLTKRQDVRLYACVPSLIQHTGIISTLKSRGHRAPSFGQNIEECHAWLNNARQPIYWGKKR